MNFHNKHQWAEKNRHAIRQARHQEIFSCNIWARIVGDYLIRPMFLLDRLKDQNYRNFLENDSPIFLENVT